ncbi:hypothetical protein SprV_0200690600 [Sparganum proliferum]
MLSTFISALCLYASLALCCSKYKDSCPLQVTDNLTALVQSYMSSSSTNNIKMATADGPRCQSRLEDLQFSNRSSCNLVRTEVRKSSSKHLCQMHVDFANVRLICQTEGFHEVSRRIYHNVPVQITLLIHHFRSRPLCVFTLRLHFLSP